MADSPDTLSPEDVASLRSLASLTPALTALLTQQAQPAEDESEEDVPEFTDADIAALAADLDDTEVKAEEPELVAASHGDDTNDDNVLALTNALEQERQAGRDRDLRLAQVETELAAKNYSAERDALAREFGIHPAVTDIIRPLIEGRGVGAIALSHGNTTVDVGETVRKFAKALASRPRLDLSQAVGSALDADESGEDKRRRDNEAFIARAKLENGLA